MSQTVQGTFATGANPVSGNSTDSLLIPTSTTTMRLTLTGLDGSNTVKSQKRTTRVMPLLVMVAPERPSTWSGSVAGGHTRGCAQPRPATSPRCRPTCGPHDRLCQRCP